MLKFQSEISDTLVLVRDRCCSRKVSMDHPTLHERTRGTTRSVDTISLVLLGLDFFNMFTTDFIMKRIIYIVDL